MRCYLDDTAPELFTAEDNVVISYGVYFACHGLKQLKTPITIKKGAYLGMRCNIVSGKNGVVIGENVIVGACALVLNDVPDNTTVVGIPAK
jgi:serine O-acetyltransferase